MHTTDLPASAVIARADLAYALSVRPHPADALYAYTSHTAAESITTCGSCDWTLITPRDLPAHEDRRRAATVANHARLAHGHR